jgi:hypothetical protein
VVNIYRNSDRDDNGGCDGQQIKYNKKDTYTKSTSTVSFRFETEDVKLQYETLNQGISLDSHFPSQHSIFLPRQQYTKIKI